VSSPHADALLAAHGELLDEDRLEEWVELFTDDCSYVVLPRENVERGLPLAAIRCESKGYLKDRVVAVRETSMYAPRSHRHVIGAARSHDDETVTASYAVFQTLTGEPTTVFSVGRYVARIVDGRFAELRVIYDSNLVDNSIIKPL
jgi:3-phenylpropionate/cinnamic acid dioxygenase small subunit